MSIYNIEVTKANGEVTNLEEFKGKVLLIVNTATKCGYTPQYESLQEIYEKYQSNGFEILDFPSNQFLGQAPGSIENINEFCQLNFGTQFTLYDKIKVNTKNAHPLYQFLKENGPDEVILKNNQLVPTGKPKNKISWNFTKFLIDRNGNILYRFAPKVEPNQIITYLEELL
ncbi:glutathione peroxidase [Acholeplasma granularum]|uniref:glutathione peroxidase n=1 Tax=Acholeplasma granularum TaxID=264635 RepID=UPI000471A53E|nr:glutathione peroxidase [Acholeplasma granularum]